MTKFTRFSQISLALLLAVIASYLIFLAYVHSFRIKELNLGFVLNPSTLKWVCALLGGVAFGVSGASSLSSESLLNQVRYYSVFMIVLMTFFVARWQFDSTPLALILSLVGLALWNAVSAFLLAKRSAQSVIVMIFLLFSFVASIVVYVFISAEPTALKGLFLWLSGDLMVTATASPVWLLSISVLMFVLVAMVCLNKFKESAALVLLCLGISLLGAVFFVGVMAASLSAKLNLLPPLKLLFSGLIASAFMVVASNLTPLLIGGYTPPLMISSAILLMPLLIFVQISNVSISNKSAALKGVEWLMSTLFLVSTWIIIWHLSKFAGELI